ncbi:MAG: hypothetical protein JJT94_16395 [Bernardetiaceae bacterium]|nr:hypothetical protein [Bernardetiaceae bacterium]
MLIKKKKIPFVVAKDLQDFLIKYKKYRPLPIAYSDLFRYSNAIAHYDRFGEDTLWNTLFYDPSDRNEIYDGLKAIYALLKADGDLSVMAHLYIDRVDLCTYGNTQPFRVRIVNRINDNFDYFYLKKADASRVYGLELEDLVSPNHITYLIYEDTLIEEHIAGMPGYQFMNEYLQRKQLNKTRLGKEFVKFNERCFVRLLGDMHANNFIVDVTPDFEDEHYRIRAIDFDQQSFEGKSAVYMPKYYKENNPIIQIGIETMTPETVRQYQREERSLIATRIKASYYALNALVEAMRKDTISLPENEKRLKTELADYYKDKRFEKAHNMGDILRLSLSRLLEESE